MKQWLRKTLINWLVRDLYCAIQAEDLLQIITDENLNKKVHYRNTELTGEQIQELVQSAEAFEKSFLWKFLKDNAKYEAQQMMYVKSSDFGGMMFGKAALWAIEQFEKAIVNIKNIGSGRLI